MKHSNKHPTCASSADRGGTSTWEGARRRVRDENGQGYVTMTTGLTVKNENDSR